MITSMRPPTNLRTFCGVTDEIPDRGCDPTVPFRGSAP
jgi:hypothetical protein